MGLPYCVSAYAPCWNLGFGCLGQCTHRALDPAYSIPYKTSIITHMNCLELWEVQFQHDLETVLWAKFAALRQGRIPALYALLLYNRILIRILICMCWLLYFQECDSSTSLSLGPGWNMQF